MIPTSSFSVNLRNIFSEFDWNIIRKIVYHRCNMKCTICDANSDRLEAHEEWRYDYKNELQILDNVHALCYWCHRNKHLGHSKLLISQSKLDMKKLEQHWADVNQINVDRFLNYEMKCFKLWRMRNRITWKITDKNKTELSESSIIEILESIGVQLP